MKNVTALVLCLALSISLFAGNSGPAGGSAAGVPGISLAQIVVATAGLDNVNGTYMLVGTLNGKPVYYQESSGNYIYSGADAWDMGPVLNDVSPYSNIRYYSGDSVASPDLVNTWITWTTGGGVDPVPTVTIGVAGLGGVVTYTVATLPASPTPGTQARVTDGDSGLAWGDTVINSGSGATPYLVSFSGANWTVIGK